MSALHVYFVADADWVVAANTADALAVWRDYVKTYLGEDPDKYTGEALPGDPVDVEPWPDDRVLTIDDSDGEHGTVVSQTCGQWAAENGRGFLASTEY